ncbi:hypothetical protein PR048_017945 [Dryococelus australis]|uniref:MADF domain-containing protein n=1 Tax=Dryococelus australis TaxID=614101 RepID=A0ABQ9HB18_9NEOP|nr:hypothetical protein PR048_017945 [Dryococelus australis]
MVWKILNSLTRLAPSRMLGTSSHRLPYKAHGSSVQEITDQLHIHAMWRPEQDFFSTLTEHNFTASGQPQIYGGLLSGRAIVAGPAMHAFTLEHSDVATIASLCRHCSQPQRCSWVWQANITACVLLGEVMNSCEELNIDDIITVIEQQPAMWNMPIDEYSNKILKRAAWEKVISRFMPDFDEKSQDEKNKRDERIRLTAVIPQHVVKPPSLPVADDAVGSGSRIYHTSKFLNYLAWSCRSSKSRSPNTNSVSINIIDKEPGTMPRPILDETIGVLNTTSSRFHGCWQKGEFRAYTPTLSMNAEVPNVIVISSSEIRLIIIKFEFASLLTKTTRRARDHEEDEDAFYKHMKEQYFKKSQAKEDQDGDYMFMVSLVHELKKVPQDRELKVKSSMINLLIDAQQYHFRPITNLGPSFVQPSIPTKSIFYGTHCYGGHEALQHQVGSS